jgi:hypothetical protein
MFKTNVTHAEIETVVKDYFHGYLTAEADQVGRAVQPVPRF